MIGESDNLPQGGTDNAQPSTDLDNPANWNFYDPDEDNEKPGEGKGTESEPAENAQGVQEADKSENEEPAERAEESPDGEQPQAPKDDVSVTMADGTTLSLGELKQGYLRQSDYTRKSQDAANKRQEIEAHAINTQNAMKAVSAFLESVLPPPPDPTLAMTQPAQYIALKAQHDQAVERLRYAHQLAQQPQNVLSELDQQKRAEYLEAEKQSMFSALPRLMSEKGRTQFMAQAEEIGKLAGITADEIRGIEDHRYLIVMDLAMEGLAARKSKQTAKAKVANVPPVTPSKQRQGNSPGIQNREAMSKLARSGSMKDAMLVDFE